MRKPSKPSREIILFLVLILSLSIAVTLYPRYQSMLSSPERKNATFDTSVDLSVTAVYSGTILASGDRICNGTIDFTAPAYSVYATNAADTQVDVECTDYYGNGECRGYDAVIPGYPAANITWVNSATYTSVNDMFSPYSSRCYFSQILTFPIAINADVTARYFNDNLNWAGNRVLGNGRASMAQFCYGTTYVNYTYNGIAAQAPGSARDMGLGAASSFYAQPGNYTFRSVGTISNCGTVVRSWRNYSLVPVKNCLYSDPAGSFTNYALTSGQITLTILRGPVMNITGYSIDSRIPEGSDGSFSVTVRNDGDINMTVNPAGITFNSGFSYTSSTPAVAFNLAPGQSQTITGMVRAPGNFLNSRNVTITIPYMGAEALVGTCDDATTASVVIGSVEPAPPEQLTLQINVDPPGTIRGTWHNVIINISVSRGGQNVEGTISNPNVSITSWNGSEWRCAPGWCPISNPSYEDEYMYLTFPDPQHGFVSSSRTIHYVPETQVYPYLVGDDWVVGLYRVSIAVRDNRMSTYLGVETVARRDTYFVIYTIGCEERS